MSTFTWMSAPTISSDAAFRKWVQGIHDAFAACGWVQTADTGQAVISSLTVPTSTSASAGYEIWRLDDELQAEAPLFVKIEFGRGVGSPGDYPDAWVTVGQSSNGSGVIGNVLAAREQFAWQGSATGSATEITGYASGDGHSICLVPWPGFVASRASWCLVIERSRSSDGTPTTDGFLIVSGWTVTVVGNGGATSSRSSSGDVLPVVLPYRINGAAASTSSTLSSDGVHAPVLPIPCLAPGVGPWVSNVIVAVHPGDAGALSVIQAATINGRTRTYRAWPGFGSPAAPIATNAPAQSSRIWPAILWED